MRGPPVPGVFIYTVDQWVAVVAEITKYPNADLRQLLIELEAIGQRYRVEQCNLRPRARQAVRWGAILDVVRAWKAATGDVALKLSHAHGWPDGPLVRYLEAALGPILGPDMIGSETLVRAVRSVREFG